tara:strand:- start:15 stop:545 length:531 start_codon:yes stop_codon:yes gene_type:complete
MKTDKERRKDFNEFKRNIKHHLLTTRFSEETWKENIKYRIEKNHNGCIYCAPDPINKNIPINSIMFVLEMNNNSNNIMGIGMIKNHSICNKYKVYEKDNYNRYVYIGKKRIDRTEMNEEEEKVMKIFDSLCFKGNKHMKRGQGIKSFPLDMLFNCKENINIDLTTLISNMFKKRLI